MVKWFIFFKYIPQNQQNLNCKMREKNNYRLSLNHRRKDARRRRYVVICRAVGVSMMLAELYFRLEEL